VRRRGYRHVAAHRASVRERGRGLQPDSAYLDALALDPAALAWLRERQPKQYDRVDALLRERQAGGA
jgi:hypothetical protein